MMSLPIAAVARDDQSNEQDRARRRRAIEYERKSDLDLRRREAEVARRLLAARARPAILGRDDWQHDLTPNTPGLPGPGRDEEVVVWCQERAIRLNLYVGQQHPAGYQWPSPLSPEPGSGYIRVRSMGAVHAIEAVLDDVRRRHFSYVDDLRLTEFSDGDGFWTVPAFDGSYGPSVRAALEEVCTIAASLRMSLSECLRHERPYFNWTREGRPAPPRTFAWGPVPIRGRSAVALGRDRAAAALPAVVPADPAVWSRAAYLADPGYRRAWWGAEGDARWVDPLGDQPWRADADAEPPDDEFDVLCEIKPDFRRSFERRRDDLDRDNSVLDYSIALFGFGDGWSGQMVADTIVASRRKYGRKIKADALHKVLTRPDTYLDPTLLKAAAQVAARRATA